MTSKSGSIPRMTTSSLVGTHIIVGNFMQPAHPRRCCLTMRSASCNLSRKHSLPFPRMLHAIIIRTHDVAHVERIDITEPNGGHQSITQEIVIISEQRRIPGENMSTFVSLFKLDLPI